MGLTLPRLIAFVVLAVHALNYMVIPTFLFRSEPRQGMAAKSTNLRLRYRLTLSGSGLIPDGLSAYSTAIGLHPCLAEAFCETSKVSQRQDRKVSGTPLHQVCHPYSIVEAQLCECILTHTAPAINWLPTMVRLGEESLPPWRILLSCVANGKRLAWDFLKRF